MKGPAFKTELVTAYPDCRLLVTKETLMVELKEKLNIAKITFTSGVSAASAEFVPKYDIDRCPLCGVALNEEGVCPKCGYRKKKWMSHSVDRVVEVRISEPDFFYSVGNFK